MKGVRYRLEGFEGQCDHCLEYWPLEVEFWNVRKKGTSLGQCLGCVRERAAAAAAERRAKPDARERANVRQRELRTASNYKVYQRIWYRQNRARILLHRRQRYARLHGLPVPMGPAEQDRLYKRDWMRAYRARKAA